LFFLKQDGRPRNLGRGVSKPKKNTVASLLAQSRALGIKPTVAGLNHHQVSLLKPMQLHQPHLLDNDGHRGQSPNSDALRQLSAQQLMNSMLMDAKMGVRGVEGISEDDDSSAPDVSSDESGSEDPVLNAHFPSDSDEPMSGEEAEQRRGRKREAGDGDDGSGKHVYRASYLDLLLTNTYIFLRHAKTPTK
jgi:hypothetical protein